MSPTTLLYVQAKAVAPGDPLLHVYQTIGCVLYKHALQNCPVPKFREQQFKAREQYLEAGEQMQTSILVPERMSAFLIPSAYQPEAKP